MFRSIFTRMLATYLLITCLVIGSVTVVISLLYRQDIFAREQANLQMVAAQVSQLTARYYNHNIDTSQLKTAVDALGSSNDAMIYVLRIDRQQLGQAQALDQTGLQADFIAQDLPAILDGATVARNRQYSKDFNTYVLFTGFPLRINDTIEGAVLLFRPVTDVNAGMARMNLYMWMVALAALLVSLPFIYLHSRSISQPIREMEQAARSIAAGESAAYKAADRPDELGQLAQSFHHMQEQLQATETMRREFIANVSHELRTPLTTINGFVRALLDGVARPENQTEYLQIVDSETQRLVRLTSDLLDLAKMQAGSHNLHPEALLVKPLIESVLAGFALQAADKELHFTARCPAELQVWADPRALKQILINIVSNAIRFAPPGGTIAVQAEIQSDQVHFTVEDNGPGIADADLPYIFDKFYRADRARSNAGHSTGLGLAIAKNLVMLQGGSIRAESKLNQGAALIFSLPALPEQI